MLTDRRNEMKVRTRISKKEFMALGFSPETEKTFERMFKGQWPIYIRRAVEFIYQTPKNAYKGLVIMRWALAGTGELDSCQHRNDVIGSKFYSRSRHCIRAYKINDLRFAAG